MYHPPEPKGLGDTLKLPSGQLWVGSRGERWWVDARKSSPALASAYLAPEPLVGIQHPSPARWVFVGASGNTYFAHSATGPLVSSSAPLEPLARVAVSSKELLGVTQAFGLRRSDDAGLTWSAIGPREVRFVDVWLRGRFALALAVPEQLWWSEDAGLTFSELHTPAFGATALEPGLDGRAVVRSPLGDATARLQSPPALAPGGSARPPLALAAPPALGPSAQALRRGRATLSHGIYTELRLAPSPSIVRGTLGEPLASTPTPMLRECRQARLASFGSAVYVACAKTPKDVVQPLSLFRSTDAGGHFEEVAVSPHGDLSRLEMAAGADARLLVTGLCPKAQDGPGCRPSGIARLGPSSRPGAERELSEVPATGLTGPALALAFSWDGTIAYGIGRRNKHKGLFSFVHRPGEGQFSTHQLRGLTDQRETLKAFSLGASRTGLLSLAIGGSRGLRRIVVLDDEGRLLSDHEPPLRHASVGQHGNRALALSNDQTWQSSDAGASWTLIGRPPADVCPGSTAACDAIVECADAGCVIGDSLTRLGWGRQPARHVLPLSPPPSAPVPDPASEPLSGFECDLLPQAWQALAGVRSLADAHQASLGQASWFALAYDYDQGSAGLWISERGAAPDVEYQSLLDPVDEAGRYALAPTLQVEGAAAVRYPTRDARGNPILALDRAEVAWADLLQGARHHQSVHGLGRILPTDHVASRGTVRLAKTDLISIAEGGLYLRVHSSGRTQPTYFLDGRKAEVAPAPDWPARLSRGRTEMVRIDGNPVSLLFSEDGATVIRATQQAGDWAYAAMTLSIPPPLSRNLHQVSTLSYLGPRVGIQRTTYFADGSIDSGVFPLLHAGPVFGPPRASPTQRDLGPRPAACRDEQREDTPRIVAPPLPGTRRRVHIYDSVDARRVMQTGSAVVYGTPEQACLAAIDADPDARQARHLRRQERALIQSDGWGWLTRVAPTSSRGKPLIEYRSMRCHLDTASPAASPRGLPLQAD